jgi:hypothetical protein
MAVRRALAIAALALTLAGCSPEDWIRLRFDPVGQGDKAVAVARCESGLNPGAVSAGGIYWGLFQLGTHHRAAFEAVTGKPWSMVLEADANSLYARWLYDQSGWAPWSCA